MKCACTLCSKIHGWCAKPEKESETWKAMVLRATMPKTATTTTNATIAAISGRKVRYWRHVRGGRGVAALTPFAESSTSDILQVDVLSTSLLTSSALDLLKFPLALVAGLYVYRCARISLYLPPLSAHFRSSDFPFYPANVWSADLSGVREKEK